MCLATHTNKSAARVCFLNNGAFICRRIPDREVSCHWRIRRTGKSAPAAEGSRMRKPNNRPDTRPEERILGEVAEHRGISTRTVALVEYLAHVTVNLTVKKRLLRTSLERVPVLRRVDYLR